MYRYRTPPRSPEAVLALLMEWKSLLIPAGIAAMGAWEQDAEMAFSAAFIGGLIGLVDFYHMPIEGAPLWLVPLGLLLGWGAVRLVRH